jgi:nucleoside-diphosphate-sugar epimerase
MRVLVIGGTLFIGRHLTSALLQAGHQVTVLHRSAASALSDGVRGLLADRNDPGQVRSAIGSERFDAVFDNVYDWERGTTAEQVAATAQACLWDGLERYVFLSSVAAFGTGLDHADDDPLAPDDDPDAYVRNKAASERALFRMTSLPAVTLRPPFVYGPGNPFYREAFFWDRMRDGRTVIVPWDGSRLMQFVYVKDIVRCCLGVLERDGAVRRGFNIGNARAVTQLEAVEAMARAMGVETRVAFVERERAIAEGGSLMGPKMYFAQYFDLPPITMKIEGARRMLRWEPTDFEAGLRETFEWWQRQAELFPKPDYSFEDRLLGR